MAALVICQAEPMQGFVDQVFRSLGADSEVAAEVARHLIRANLSGHDSHGVIRIPQYVKQMDSGEIAAPARPVILRETDVTALIDAQRGFGHYSTIFAMDWAIEHAREHGIAAAAVRHSSHIGRVGEYTERAAEQGLIGIATVGSSGPGVGGMVLYGGRQRFLGANPWSFGIPAEGRIPMVFDGSTSAVAEGKVRMARAKGVELPPGCIIDKDGNPSTRPDDFYEGGALLPMGGEVAAHKGFGLAMSSALVGGLASIDDPSPTAIGASLVQQTTDTRGWMAGVFVQVINPGWFGDAGSYARGVSEMLSAAKKVPPAPGVAEVILPGEPEARSRESRLKEGIPVPEAVWRDLEQVAARFGLTMPVCTAQ